ncbi:MAG: hybrid sensor histidine kinase/response regulator [Saprospiraceae bacterium]|nr:MAG: hybrid sensor histidine kinase/response regulator [Saprospiraceae bacterium]
MEYDGVSWRLIKTDNKTVIRSLAIDENNRIFVGAYGEIGYLAPDTLGQLQYVSLLPYLEEKYYDFSDVWQTIITSDGVYFSTQKYIFRWANQQMHVWESPTYILHTALVNDQLYIRQWKTGLMQMVSDSLILVPEGEKFLTNRISMMLPYSGTDNKGQKKEFILICSQTEGLFLYDGISVVPFRTSFDELLMNARIYKAIRLTNGDYAIATMQDGVIIMDEKGNLLHHLNKASGLQNNTVWTLCQDKQGGLWIGMNIGISRAEINVPLTYFSDREGVEGGVFSITRHQGTLYIATSSGIYYLDENPKETGQNSRQFKRVSDIPPQVWAQLSMGKTLLGGTFQGLYEIKKDQAYLINRGYIFSICRSQKDTNRIFTGLQGGLGSYYYDEGQWRNDGIVDGITQEIRDVVEAPDGKLWLTTRYQGLLQVDFSNGFTLQPKITHFDTLQGLPPGDRNVAFPLENGMGFATPQGLYRFEEIQQRFLPDTSLIRGFENRRDAIFSVTADHDENLWLLIPEGSKSGVALRQEDGTYSWNDIPLIRTNNGDFNVAYPDPMNKEITWFGGNERLIQYDASSPHDYALDFNVIIRKVIVNEDSLIYDGGLGSEDNFESISEFTFANNSLKFLFAAPSFDDESKNEYQYFLEGYDQNWSKWSSASRKDYTNLPEGNYRFQVRAKNIYQHISSTAVFEFEILPPFYRTWWAYLLYLLFFVGLFYAFRQYETNRLSKKHLREIELLEYDKLKELDQLKSRFFADISHEFRTPLTLILGPLENFISKSTKKEDIREYALMKRNAQSLLRLINQLLDLSRLEARKMKLETHYDDIIPFIKGVFYAFESLAETKKISMHFTTDSDNISLYYDPDKMAQVITNVLSNAFKFTPEGGMVSVKIKRVDTEDLGESLEIGIVDTGIGIPANHLPHVFERFYQSKDVYRHDGQGTGIGLALAKELVELHKGRIGVESRVGEGTQFTILLPIGKAPSQTGSITEDFTPKSLAELRPDLIETDVISDSLITAENSQPVFADSEEVADKQIILLVEDNADMLSFIRDQLPDYYQIIEAIDGQEGIEKALETIPELIISDVMMPRMDGLQLCDFLKNDERTSHIPIILLTAKADVESRIAGLERGADVYLAKPFNRQELLAHLRNLLDLRMRLRERYSSLQAPAPTVEKDLQIEDAFLQKARLIVEKHLSDLDFDMDRFSRSLSMSRSQLFRKIKALTGKSPSLFIRSIRLKRAKELLQTTDRNVTEVAYDVGFSTPAFFSDAFLEEFGIRPSEVRK